MQLQSYELVARNCVARTTLQLRGARWRAFDVRIRMHTHPPNRYPVIFLLKQSESHDTSDFVTSKIVQTHVFRLRHYYYSRVFAFGAAA
jgi:hypothetical protein